MLCVMGEGKQPGSRRQARTWICTDVDRQNCWLKQHNQQQAVDLKTNSLEQQAEAG